MLQFASKYSRTNVYAPFVKQIASSSRTKSGNFKTVFKGTTRFSISIFKSQLNEPQTFVNLILLTWNRFSFKGCSQGIRCVSLIGNPVKLGSGPAAVTLLFLLFVVYKERTLLAANATVSTDRDGKVAKRAGEPEDLPCQIAIVLRRINLRILAVMNSGSK